MMGRFPSKLKPAFLLGLINNKLKLADDFIPKLKSHIPSSDEFNKFLQDCKNDPNETRITYCIDIEACASGNCVHHYFTGRVINIQVVADHLKVE